MRLHRVQTSVHQCKFQFTHPRRGATKSDEVYLYPSPVSIHAPQEGCDGGITRMNTLKSSFNSRTPGGVRPLCLAVCRHHVHVSIHAPQEGCDSPNDREFSALARFNSRTPGGVRLRPLMMSFTANLVSIHAPQEGCDRAYDLTSRVQRVSIHAPQEGCD